MLYPCIGIRNWIWSNEMVHILKKLLRGFAHILKWGTKLEIDKMINRDDDAPMHWNWELDWVG